MIATSALSATPSPVALMSSRLGPSDAEPAAMADQSVADQGRKAATQPPADKPTLLDRYTSLAFVYNPSAARVVMLMRSPTTGETESQVPSEVALRMYQATARAEERKVAEGTGAERSGAESFGMGTPGKGMSRNASPQSGVSETGVVDLTVSASPIAPLAKATPMGTGPSPRAASASMSSGRVDVVV